MNNWLYSPYCPTTSIIDAAKKLYATHKVEDINRSDAKGEDLKRTTNTLLQLIEQAKKNNERYLCLVTGVPGAGKTLIGLSVATKYHDEEEKKNGKENRSVYLSGNRPLVMVLQEALAREAGIGCKLFTTLTTAKTFEEIDDLLDLVEQNIYFERTQN